MYRGSGRSILFNLVLRDNNNTFQKYTHFMMIRRMKWTMKIRRNVLPVILVFVTIYLASNKWCMAFSQSLQQHRVTTSSIQRIRSDTYFFAHIETTNQDDSLKMNNNEKYLNENKLRLDGERRYVISSVHKVMMSSLVLWNNHFPIAISNAATTSSPATITSANNNNYISADMAKVTHQIFFNVRISRQDGTFYVRDDDNDNNNDPDNQVFYGQLVFALFGQNAPNHVQRFLDYVVDPTSSTTTTTSDENETPYPSYSRSSFTQYDDATGILYGGTIPSLEVIEIQNSVAIRYGNRLLPSKLWIESDRTIPKISHDTIGLLTHQQLDTTPIFGITTRKDSTILNPTHTVFGKLIINPVSEEFLRRISTIPKYSVDRRIITSSSALPSLSSTESSIYSTEETNGILRPTTDAIYMAQRDFFRNTAKTFGDTRLNKLYDGKLLRRVEVTQVGVLS